MLLASYYGVLDFKLHSIDKSSMSTALIDRSRKPPAIGEFIRGSILSLCPPVFISSVTGESESGTSIMLGDFYFRLLVLVNDSLSNLNSIC